MEALGPGHATGAAQAALRRHAILCVLAASSCFSVVAALIKAVATDIPPVEIAFFRSLMVGALILPLLHRRGGIGLLLRTRQPWGHVARTCSGFTGMVTSYYGYAHLPLAANTALGFAMPLVLTVLCGPFLGERVGWRRAMAVLAGLAGVLIMVRPWRDTADALPLWPVAVVLFGVIAWAFSMISIRRLGASGESNEAIIVWFSIGGFGLASLLVAPVWVTPGLPQLAGLVAMGAMSAVAQMLMTEGYRSGEATLVAPFEYGAILYTSLMGIVIWGEIPDAWGVAGIGVIVGSGLYVWRRETLPDAPGR